MTKELDGRNYRYFIHEKNDVSTCRGLHQVRNNKRVSQLNKHSYIGAHGMKCLTASGSRPGHRGQNGINSVQRLI